ncbi:MAG: NAD(P)H-binding protein [Candidatus Marinimicrobia bacterium]|nr:NAD(P)H-binding protein [Candidatus Neomarinimicrobiota bacterium]
MKPVLILGGTGHYGHHIVSSLRKRHKAVRVLTRNPDNAKKLFDDQVDIIVGDITDTESTKKALTGVDTLIISVSAFSLKLIRRLHEIEYDSVLRVLQEAQLAGVERVIYISVYDIRKEALEQTNKYFASIALIKQAVEDYLAKSDFNWTILGAPPAMDMFFAFIRKDKMMVPGGGPPALPSVATADVGEIAAQAALRDDLNGQRIRLAGPEALSFPDAARRIGEATNREIKFRKIPVLPIKIISILVWPFTPYLRYLAGSIKMLNMFPADLAADVPKDHQYLQNNFDYQSVTLEMAAEKWRTVLENSTH